MFKLGCRCVCVRGQEVMVNFQSLPLHTERQTWIMRFVDTCCESTEAISWGLGSNKSGRPGRSSFTLGRGGQGRKRLGYLAVPQMLQLFVIPWTAAHQVSLSFIVPRSLLRLMSNVVCDAIQPSHPLSPPSHLQSFPASGSFPMNPLFPSSGQSI